MSPEAFFDESANRSDNRDVVERFYAAIAEQDPEAMASIVADAFAEDVTLEAPPSLPHGGTTTGAKKLARLFGAAASPEVPAGATNFRTVRVAERAGEDRDEVVAEVAFDWVGAPGADPVPSGAVEWWTFEDMKVIAIKAFYWDTDALT